MALKTKQQKALSWIIYPDDLGIPGFKGYMTKFDPASAYAKGHIVAGQNTTVADGKITVRQFGSEAIGAVSAVTTPIKTQRTFEKRDGTKPEVRMYGTVVEWRHPDVSAWDTLETAFTSGKTFGVAALSYNADATPFLYFCNAYEALYRWNGAYGRLASVAAGPNTITLQGTDTLATLGFSAAASIVIDGIDYAYTGLSGQTFTGVTPDPTLGGHAVGEPVAQVPTTVAAAPRGNILMVKDAALFISGILYNSAGTLAPRPTEVHRSKVGDATNWTIGATAGDPKRQEFPEGGGRILALAQDEQAIYVIKETCVAVWVISDTDTFNVDVLKAYDGKSQTTGAKSGGAVWSGANGTYFLNQMGELMAIQRMIGINTPQAVRISEPIEPTLVLGVHTNAVGITFRGKAYLATMSSSAVSANDVVYVFDERKGEWDTPISGWQVNDFNIVGTNLHWGSSLNPTSFTTIDDKTDSTLDIGAGARTFQDGAGRAYHLQKTADMAYIEGYIGTNTSLTISLLFDEDGWSGQKQLTILGTDASIVFTSADFNPFGFNAFGYEQFGSNVAQNDLKKFRVYWAFKSNIEFFTWQADFASDGAGQNWEILRYGLRLVETLPETRKMTKKSN